MVSIKRNDMITCSILNKNNRKYLVNYEYDGDEPLEDMDFRVIGITYPYKDTENPLYMILLHSDIVGYIVDSFHIINNGVHPNLLGQPFNEITKEFIK